MSKKKYDALVFIGRMNPPHKAHLDIIQKASELADKVIVFLGSSFTSRTKKNIFTFAERKMMLREVFPDESTVVILPARDYPTDAQWVSHIQNEVGCVLNSRPAVVGLIGHEKDGSSYYLKIFPQWSKNRVKVDGHYEADGSVLSSTDIRNNFMYMSGAELKTYLDGVTHPRIVDKLVLLRNSPDVFEFLNDNLINDKYRKSWEVGVAIVPYAPTFVTVDAVVVQSGHVLMVKRNASPGMGLWALPGGFVDQEETLLQAAIRELLEETKIKIPERTLLRLANQKEIFDRPDRSARGRTITTAFFIDLGVDLDLPKVATSSTMDKNEVRSVRWVPFQELDGEKIFEDHLQIISHFVKL